MQAEVVNGPTTDGLPWSVPPFSWAEDGVANLTHRGQPRRFSFDFQKMDPASPPPAVAARCAGGAGGGSSSGAGSSGGGEAGWGWGPGSWLGGKQLERAESATLSSSLLIS